MALPSTRVEYRVALSHVDRGVEVTQTVIAALHPSETREHLALRVLAYCLLYQEGIAFGPGLGDPEAADLWGRDRTGELTLWVECGAADAEKLRRVLQHHGQAAVHAVFSEPRRRQELVDQIAGLPRAPRGLARVTLWSVDPALCAALAARAERRQRWAVTIVGDHLYIDADGVSLDGAVERAGLG